MYNLPNFVHLHFGKSAEELGDIEKRVLAKAHERKIISTDINAAIAAESSVGQRLADGIARVGGSWSFILAFLAFLVIWTVINTVILMTRAFDPYPFVFLNLILSMLAAIQAPIIMMSQNRQAEHDRLDAAHDYEVNLKSEIEIMALHDKLDQLRNDQLVTILARIERLAEDIQRLESRRKGRAAD